MSDELHWAEVGAEVKRLRNELGKMTQEQLVDRSGERLYTVRGIESGTLKPQSMGALMAISLALDRPVHYLEHFLHHGTAPKPVVPEESSPAERAFRSNVLSELSQLATTVNAISDHLGVSRPDVIFPGGTAGTGLGGGAPDPS